MSSIEAYVIVWSALLFGAALGVALSGMVRPTRGLTLALTLCFVAMALCVRPFVYSMVLP